MGRTKIKYCKEIAIELATNILKKGMSRKEVCDDMDISVHQYQKIVNMFPIEKQELLYAVARKNSRKG